MSLLNDNLQAQSADALVRLSKKTDSLLNDRGQYLFVPPGLRSNNIGDHATILHSGVAINYSEFTAPCDYAELVSADLLVVGVTGGAVSMNVNTDLGSVGELYNARSAGPLNHAPTLVINVVTALSLLTILTSMVRGDQVGVNVARVSGVTFHQLGIRLYF